MLKKAQKKFLQNNSETLIERSLKKIQKTVDDLRLR